MNKLDLKKFLENSAQQREVLENIGNASEELAFVLQLQIQSLSNQLDALQKCLDAAQQ